MNKAKTVQEHTCKAIEKIDTVGVEKILLPKINEARWFLRISISGTNNQLHEIKYCPYCGAELEGAEG